MNNKAIHEIGEIIGVKRNWRLQLLLAAEIFESREYAEFKKKYPELCRLAELDDILVIDE